MATTHGGTATAAAAAAGMAGRVLKTKVASNMGAPYVRRFYDTLWCNRLGQLSTSAAQATQSTAMDVGMSGGGSSSGSSGKVGGDGGGASAMSVQSDLQPYALHKFGHDTDWSLVVALPRRSVHYHNVRASCKVSFMVGHTDPQLFHWFKQLGAVPPRALVSGAAEVLHGELQAEVWDKTLVRHPVLHSMAQEMWEANDANIADEDRERLARRQREEDDKRMRRMSSTDWRAKFADRERDPTRDEDEEMPVYVMKPDAFAVLRLRPDTRLWLGVTGQARRVWETAVPAPDPLYRCAPRFIAMLNATRAKLVASLNINYAMRLTNVFVFALDQAGLWALGTEDNVAGRNGVVHEAWSELRIEYGKDQRVCSEQELEWWVRGLMRHGVPEVDQVDNSATDASHHINFEFRHS